MNRFKYAVAALAVIAFVSPSLAEDMKGGPTTRTEQSMPAGGDAKHDAMGDVRTGGAVNGGRRHDAQLESRRGSPRWHHARAEVVVSGHRHHRHHHHHDTM